MDFMKFWSKNVEIILKLLALNFSKGEYFAYKSVNSFVLGC